MCVAATDWRFKGQQKAESVNALIPEHWRIPYLPSVNEQRDVRGEYVRRFLSPREVDITETNAVDIVAKTSSGIWSAVDVTSAFCHRAALAHQLVNCLHEILFTDALTAAKRLDDEFAVTKKPRGPLHGLPVSLKDQIHVSGVDTTMGYVGWIDTFEGKIGTGKEKVFESEVVRELRAAGAILFCKTSVPQTLHVAETINNIIGYTYNPANRNVSSGGSSGGEGALIAMRGSPMGLGTDIGGSIRIPSDFNGLYGLRPSHGRLPFAGVANSLPGEIEIPAVLGPLSTSVSSLKLMVKSLLAQEPWLHDPQVVELPWREAIVHQVNKSKDEGKMCFGLLYSDGLVNPQPPIRRAMQTIESLLRKLGHEIVYWRPPSHIRALELAVDIFTSDGGADFFENFALSGEPPVPQLEKLCGSGPRPAMPVDRFQKLNVLHRQYQQEYLDYWTSTAQLTSSGNPVDAVITPVLFFSAAEMGKTNYLGGCAWVNLLDYTSVSFPVTSVDEHLDIYDDSYEPISVEDKQIRDNYDPAKYHGTPVGLQIVGRRFQEEKILTIAQILGDEIQEEKIIP